MSIWFTFLYQPLVNVLLFLYQAVGGNLGLAIILITVLIRLALILLTLPGMKSAQKMHDLKPELDKLKKKHKNDKQALAQAQLELYRQYNLNPLSGLLPMVVQFVVLIALFQVLNNVIEPANGVSGLNEVLYPFVRLPSDTTLNTWFIYRHVTEPDVIRLPFSINLGLFSINTIPGVFLIGAALMQFISSKMMVPKAVLTQNNDKAGEEAMATAMQKQMTYFMPLMTIFIGLRFDFGLVLYWITFSAMMIIQQLYFKKKTLLQDKTLTQ
ncbi:MAG: YidC/Oxa1 family membrane protein insertase [Patescibacteria group bacterium]|jgi:YidC/Oxa1 family membrane protein insertase